MLLTEKKIRLNTPAEKSLYQYATGQSAQPGSRDEYVRRMSTAAEGMIESGDPELELLARVFVQEHIEVAKGKPEDSRQ